MSKLISIGELADLTGYPVSTLRHWANKGEIPSVKLASGHRRFDSVSVALALSKKRHPSQLGMPNVQSYEVQSEIWHKSFDLTGLKEDNVWRELVPVLDIDMQSNARFIFQHAFTEMLNNAIDHSEGLSVAIKVGKTSDSISFELLDDGVGVFKKLKKEFGLASEMDSLGELTKGKQTTAPSQHTGEGIFFTSKMVDKYRISANQLSWLVDNVIEDFTVIASAIRQGTSVFCEIALGTERNYKDVFAKFSVDGGFVKTKPVVKLFEKGDAFISRSEAKRLTVGLDQFEEVTLDFAKVLAVGQGFVDEIFRVWANSNPAVKINAINMNPEVEFMVRRGQALINSSRGRG